MVLVLSRKRLQISIIALVMVVIFSSILGGSIASANAKSRELPIYRVDRDDKKIAISFDAAWGADKTKKIVDILVDNDIKATFFLVGFWIDKYQEEVKYIYDHGMEIGNHSESHLKMSTVSRDVIKKELLLVNEKVEKLTSFTPKVFRPPFGDYNNELILTAREIGLTPIQWDVDSLDWKGLSGDEIVRRIDTRTKSGSIILCHNNSDHILDALPIVIKNLKNKGYEFVTMSELIYHEDYIIDNNGVQHLKRQEE